MGHLYLCRKLVLLVAAWDLVVVMVPEALALYRPFPFWFVTFQVIKVQTADLA